MEKILKDIFKVEELNSSQELIAKYLPTIISILIGIIVIKYLMRLFKKIITKTKIPKKVHSFTLSIIKGLLYFLLIISICSHLGIDITSVIAAFSIVGVAISLSVQNTLSNVMAGISLLSTNYFSVDDYIEAGGVSGTVLKIGIFSCKLKTIDGKDIYVPNSSILASNIINYSSEPNRRLDISIGVSYNENIDKIKNALNDIIDRTENVIKSEPIFVGITAFKDSSIDYTIRVWVKNSDYWDTNFALLENIKRTFEKENIEIPFNQLDVHLKKD